MPPGALRIAFEKSISCSAFRKACSLSLHESASTSPSPRAASRRPGCLRFSQESSSHASRRDSLTSYLPPSNRLQNSFFLPASREVLSFI